MGGKYVSIDDCGDGAVEEGVLYIYTYIHREENRRAGVYPLIWNILPRPSRLSTWCPRSSWVYGMKDKCLDLGV
jgi:hypothetical protein